MHDSLALSWLVILVIVALAGLAVIGGVIALVVLTTSKRRDGPANPNLFPCPDCGRRVSHMAKSCPNCGRPFSSEGPN